jgi:hypothetical protein
METTLTNQAGPAFQWNAAFPLTAAKANPCTLVDGTPVLVVIEQRLNHQLAAIASVRVQPGQTRTAKLKLA